MFALLVLWSVKENSVWVKFAISYNYLGIVEMAQYEMAQLNKYLRTNQRNHWFVQSMARSQPNSRPLSLLLALPGDDDFGLHSALLSGDETRPQASFFINIYSLNRFCWFCISGLMALSLFRCFFPVGYYY